GQQVKDEDQGGERQDGQDQLDHRPVDPPTEVATQLLPARVKLLQLMEDLGQVARLFADAGQRQEQRRKMLALFFQGLLQALPFLQRQRQPARNRPNRLRAAPRLLLKDLRQMQTG